VADKRHTYSIRVDWTGNQGTGTSAYRAYSRAHEISAQGKTAIAGSSDPVFRGDAARWNPAELLVAALSACHQRRLHDAAAEKCFIARSVSFKVDHESVFEIASA
jgi:organic hydroperoxide reductase OsmC/OhrA